MKNAKRLISITILFFMLSFVLFSCQDTSYEKSPNDLCIVIGNESFLIPQNSISCYYASLVEIVVNYRCQGQLSYPFEIMGMTHNDKVAYTTKYLINKGYGKEVMRELKRVCVTSD